MKKNYQKPKIVQKSKLNIPFISIFLANSGGLSSKRILGVFGFVICCIIFVLGFALNKEIPEFSDILLITSASLCGVDSVTQIFQKRVGDK